MVVSSSRRARIAARLARLGAVVALGLMVAGCGGDSLTGTNWLLAGASTELPGLQGEIPAGMMTKYTIVFAEDGTWSGQADCNAVGGTYETGDDNAITIALGPSTLMACPEGSLADQYLAGLKAAREYRITAEQMVLALDGDDTFTFASQPEE